MGSLLCGRCYECPLHPPTCNCISIWVMFGLVCALSFHRLVWDLWFYNHLLNNTQIIRVLAKICGNKVTWQSYTLWTVMFSLRWLSAKTKRVKFDHRPKTFNALIAEFKYPTCRLSDRHSVSFGDCKIHSVLVAQALVSWHVSSPGSQQYYTSAKTEARNFGNALKCWLTKGSCWENSFSHIAYFEDLDFCWKLPLLPSSYRYIMVALSI